MGVCVCRQIASNGGISQRREAILLLLYNVESTQVSLFHVDLRRISLGKIHPNFWGPENSKNKFKNIKKNYEKILVKR